MGLSKDSIESLDAASRGGFLHLSTSKARAMCKENGPLAHLLWILVFDDQHNQVGLMNLQVIIFVVQ